jgi:hypothetical protein
MLKLEVPQKMGNGLGYTLSIRSEVTQVVMFLAYIQEVKSKAIPVTGLGGL